MRIFSKIRDCHGTIIIPGTIPYCFINRAVYLKQTLYLLNQLLVQLEEMQNLIATEHKKALEQYTLDLRKIENKFLESPSLQNRHVVKKRIDSIGKKMRRNFKPQQVQDHLVK